MSIIPSTRVRKQLLATRLGLFSTLFSTRRSHVGTHLPGGNHHHCPLGTSFSDLSIVFVKTTVITDSFLHDCGCQRWNETSSIQSHSPPSAEFPKADGCLDLQHVYSLVNPPRIPPAQIEDDPTLLTLLFPSAGPPVVSAWLARARRLPRRDVWVDGEEYALQILEPPAVSGSFWEQSCWGWRDCVE